MANERETTTTTSSEIVVIDDDDILTESFTMNSHCCTFFSCFGTRPSPARCGLWSSSPSVWERLHQTAAIEEKWWAGPVTGLKKARVWSEIIAGPKWKTFIRRFNRNGKTTRSGSGKFQYDALSYSLNFDEGPEQNGNFDEGGGFFPDFSSRFASISSSCKSSMDLGKSGIPTCF